MGRLTTHVLDTARGCPGKGIRVELFRLGPVSAGDGPEGVASAITNDDGRCDAPLLSDAAFTAGRYQLVFHAGAYFEGLGIDGGAPRFLDEIVIHFGVDEPKRHYHVPLLLSPYGYSTYRGS